MVVIGISALDCESAVSMLIDGRVVWAASEERFARVKQQSGFPWRALEKCFADTGVSARDVEAVTYPFLGWYGESKEMLKSLAISARHELRGRASADRRLYHLARYVRATGNNILRLHPRWHFDLMNGLEEFGLRDKLTLMKHHRVHAVSTYYTSGYDRALIVIMDGYGSGECTTIWLGERGQLRQLLSIRSPHSLGNMYAFVTKALGFLPNRHEGKILGLAAYGQVEPVRSELLARFQQWPGGYAIDAMLALARDSRHQAERYRREDVAAGYQAVLEEVGVALVEHFVREYRTNHVAMAGGVMANVKFNQRIAEIAGVEEVFVFPAMADPGTSFGGALAYHADKNGAVPRALHDVYLGPEYSESEMEAALARAGLDVYRFEDSADKIARLLVDGFVVARFNGRMEFGPRALGNRSVLSRASDPSINKSLNDRLKRTEFMPFAPITLAEHADSCYRRIRPGRYASEFMTMTFDCTESMKRHSPAAVHVDGTARPQLVRAEVNPTMHRILRRYHELTGVPSIINTSFNMHEEPIVCTPDDAIRGFLDGNLEFLSMGPFLVPHPTIPAAKGILEERTQARVSA